MPLVGTVDCAVWLTLRSILLDSDIYGNIPQNSGLTRPITIFAPEGCLANPIFPAPVIARFCRQRGGRHRDEGDRSAVPKQVSAGIGNLRVMAFSGVSGGARGCIWRSWKARMAAVRQGRNGRRRHPLRQYTQQSDRDIESHLPLRVLTLRAARERAGAGASRGGIGSIRAFELLEDGAVSVEGDGQRFRPWGFLGGSDGSPARVVLAHASGGEEDLPSRSHTAISPRAIASPPTVRVAAAMESRTRAIPRRSSMTSSTD